ncbi:MAG: hypothetical protein L6277_13650 [Desulfobacterales bacterium]|nr:hypothetical protein [Pseudomonadota bacterium]MBU4355520.1 hypothetical protein [Pseudomonadota bacterium]MCG2773117.1 hypothetical protein [Desulfobacterales bacterium]
MTLKMLGRSLLLWSLVSFLPLAQAYSADIDLYDYRMRTAGQWSSFIFSYPYILSIFFVTLNVEMSGDYVGKYRMGDFATPDATRCIWVIFDWDATNLNLYATSNGKIDPPARLPRVMPLDTLIDNPLEADVGWYLAKLPSLTVPAGTFQDVLVWFVLDKTTDPNLVNFEYGLSSLPYGITHVRWYGRGLGELQELKVEAATGATQMLFVLYDYGSKSTTPPYLLLLD